ncbi:MAG: hypothetical protein P8179_01915 [Candidatus Thiodiazotropha sp.]
MHSAQRRHVPPQACYSRCSVIHPAGDYNHRSYFLQNQKPVIRMERSTDFFRFKSRTGSPAPLQDGAYRPAVYSAPAGCGCGSVAQIEAIFIKSIVRASAHACR